MKPTRQRLLETLRVHPDATASDLARILRLTHADVRYHLKMLLAEEVILVTDRKKGGRGRPARRYRLTSAADPQRLDLLVDALLAEILGNLAPSDEGVLLRNIAARLVEDEGERKKDENSRQTSIVPGLSARTSFHRHPWGRGSPGASSLSTRLVDAVARLNNLGYRARWEAHAESPRVIIEHCPFSTLHVKYPFVRRLDSLLIENLLATPVKEIPNKGKDAGDTYSLFGAKSLS
jgi:predicted ArsR family transcriptional regulator